MIEFDDHLVCVSCAYEFKQETEFPNLFEISLKTKTVDVNTKCDHCHRVAHRIDCVIAANSWLLERR